MEAMIVDSDNIYNAAYIPAPVSEQALSLA
jgi:hypothetical protein